jgi:hypothetical protein
MLWRGSHFTRNETGAFFFLFKPNCHFIILFYFIFIFSFFFYYSYVRTRLGSFLPPAPTPSLTTHSAPPQTGAFKWLMGALLKQF